MIKLKKLLTLLLIANSIMIIGCTKEGDTGPVGPTGSQGQKGDPGPEARTFSFNLTFNPGDNFKSYNGITGVDTDDVMLFYVYYETLASVDYWTALPVIIGGINYIPEFSDQSNIIFINTKKADGSTGSPWGVTTTLSFKVVLIKSSLISEKPYVDYTNYQEVKETFGLEN